MLAQNLGMTLLRCPVYPLLFSVYFVLAVGASDNGELTALTDLVRPLVITTAFTAAVWLASRVVTKDDDRRAILTFVVVVCFSTYGYWVMLLARFPYGQTTGQMLLVPACTMLVAGTALAARRSGRSRSGLTQYLNVTSLILLGVAAGELARSHARSPLPVLSQVSHPLRPDTALQQPHVFVVVLDTYTGAESLRSWYGWNNTPFETFLTTHGFRVVPAAHANYVHTPLALSAMLNLDYLDSLVAHVGTRETKLSLAYPLIEDNRVVRAFKAAGYRFVFFPTGFAATADNRLADVRLPDPKYLTREFEMVWVRTTALNSLLSLVCGRVSCPWFVPFTTEAARMFDWKFEQLGRLSMSGDPLLVFAHFIVPHPPYVYDSQCTHVVPYWPVRDDGKDSSRVKKAYIAQIACVNRKLEVFIEELERSSSRPYVVVLQSDHGHGRFGLRGVPPLSAASAASIRERLDIFAAYRLPGAPVSLVNDSIGPVNAMRALVGYYLHIPLPPLAEASYWSSADQPFDLTRVR
jgi:hypothetical protein